MNNFRALLLLSAVFILQPLTSQTKPTTPDRPKLVVGIVVDQMRNDYIYRYWDRFGTGGFKRLVSQGYYFRNTHYNYIPTYTGPGHCSIYTGTTPRYHGIIANDWCVKAENRMTYCAYDNEMKSIGTASDEGKMSPRQQRSTTIGDELKMSTNQRAKVFAVAIKDRSAVLPAGHTANGAFWLESTSGTFISSSFYMQELPGWVQELNSKKLADQYLAKGWSTLYPIESYTSSIADDNRYESKIAGKDKPVFPYDFKSVLEKGAFGYVRNTPYGNTLTKDMAIACLKAEKMGKGGVTDLLCISFSTPDIIAHAFGPRSIEVEDIYLRLDKDIEEILNALDAEVGKGNYTVFLTADHGGADVPNHLTDNKIPAGFAYESVIRQETKKFMQAKYGDSSLVMNVSNEQIFLDEKKIADKNLAKNEMEQQICNFLVTLPVLAEAYPSVVLKNGSFAPNDLRSYLQNGYNHQMSGNVAYILKPDYMDHGQTGTTHGAGYNYDTHVPLVFYGFGIKKGESLKYTTITQIAPTICELIKINQPNACTAEPLNDLIK